MTDNVISTRVRLARNRHGVRFPAKMSDVDADGIIKAVKSALGNGYEIYYAARTSEADAGALMERHLISPELLRSRRGAAITDGESVSVMACEEDHVRIQAIVQGFDPVGAYDMAKAIDDKIGRNMEYAFSDRLGYLTACPSNLGCGMRLSVMCFLPALNKSGKMEEAVAILSETGITVRGEKGEGSKGAGYAFQISNRRSLGVNEKEIIASVSDAANILERMESEERKRLLATKKDNLKDGVFRALGTLRHAFVMSHEELTSLCGEIKFGIDCGFLRGMTTTEVDELCARLQPYNMMLERRRKMGEEERVRERAARLPSALTNLYEVR